MTNEEELVVALANRQKRRSRRSSSAGPLYAHARKGDQAPQEEGEGEGGETPQPKPKKQRAASKA